MIDCISDRNEQQKPYGVDFKAFRYDPKDDWFHFVPEYELRRATSHAN